MTNAELSGNSNEISTFAVEGPEENAEKDAEAETEENKEQAR